MLPFLAALFLDESKPETLVMRNLPSYSIGGVTRSGGRGEHYRDSVNRIMSEEIHPDRRSFLDHDEKINPK